MAAVEMGERAAAMERGLERIGGADGFLESLELAFDHFDIAGDFGIVDSGFGAPGAVDLPAGEGDVLDEIGFGGPLGLEFLHVVAEYVLEDGFGLVGEQELEGGESVAQGVARGLGFAIGGGGSTG
jgi:hypothetical protein